MKKETIIGAVCALLILLFLYASVSKLVNIKVFEHDMYNQPFPHWLASFFIVAVPLSEILISLALLFDRTQLAGLWASLALMGLFTLYTAAILLHLFPRVPCGCGGVIRKLTWNQHLILNLFYVGITAGAIIALKRKGKPEQAKQIVYT